MNATCLQRLWGGGHGKLLQVAAARLVEGDGGGKRRPVLVLPFFRGYTSMLRGCKCRCVHPLRIINEVKDTF